MSRSPPLLRKMNEVAVGELRVYHTTIIEPLTGLVVAKGFPNGAAALQAAVEMNEVADWFGILKVRAEGRNPNCQDELQRIATKYGGELATNATTATHARAAAVVKQRERS
jgi:hypothetical protein